VLAVQLVPHIGTLSSEYLCAPVILLANDSSVLIDSSAQYHDAPYDSLAFREWQWGDFKANSSLKNPAHYYTSNGNYTITLKVISRNGCVAYDSVPIQVKGPRPRFVITSDTVGCAPFKVTVNNTSAPMLNWIWSFTDTTIYSTTNDSDVTFTYTKPGIYHVRLLGEDNIWNPVTQSYKSCTALFPDTTTNIDIRDVRVIASPPIDIFSNATLCIGEQISISSNAPYPYTKFTWEPEPNTSVVKSFPDTVLEYRFNEPGKKLIKLITTSQSPAGCIDSATRSVEVSQVEADFDIKVISSSKYEFVNKSTGGPLRYEWSFSDPQNEAETRSLEESPSHDYKFLPGPHIVCLSAFNAFDCFDSICKTTPLTQALIIPNTFSPNNDNSNDAFDIYIQGQQLYELIIFNRWGIKVYESSDDGTGNDGINWNGKNMNNGNECPTGTYFYTFRYQLLNMDNPISTNGTITLLR
jgi:gliding motility-associated-like protein